MFLTLWHNVVCILTIFPGILSLLLGRLPIMRNYSERNLFLLCALAMVGYDVAVSHHAMVMYYLGPAILILAFACEVLSAYGLKFFRSSARAIYHQMQNSFVVLIAFPFFEEYVYRFFLYDLFVRSYGDPILFVVASTALFVCSHFYSQREKALTKIPLGIILSLCYVCTQNIFFCLAIHISFNLCIFFYNQIVGGTRYNF